MRKALADLVEIQRRDERSDPDIIATDTWREQAWENARAALQATPSRPVTGEPVAWRYREHGSENWILAGIDPAISRTSRWCKKREIEALYAAPLTPQDGGDIDPNDIWEALLAERYEEGLGADAPPQAVIAFTVDYLSAKRGGR